MSKVLVMTDTVSGISEELAAKYGIRVLPAANIVIDGKLYPDGEGITREEAYRYLQKNPDKFTTATLSPSYFLDVYREVSKQSNDIVFITFSSTMSATNKIANISADLLKNENPQVNLKVIDSKCAASSLALLAIDAAIAAEAGMNLDQIEELVMKVRQKTGGLMMLDTLKYVYRTGRYPKMFAMMASLLQIKPISRIKVDGTMDVVDKVRKREDGYRKLLDLIKQEAGTDSLHFIVSHSNSPEIGEEFSQMLKSEFNCLSMAITEYSPIMGYSSGPRCLFVGFHPAIEKI